MPKGAHTGHIFLDLTGQRFVSLLLLNEHRESGNGRRHLGNASAIAAILRTSSPHLFEAETQKAVDAAFTNGIQLIPYSDRSRLRSGFRGLGTCAFANVVAALLSSTAS